MPRCGLRGAITSFLQLRWRFRLRVTWRWNFGSKWAAHCLRHRICALYLRNRRAKTSFSQSLLALALLVGVPAVSYLLSEQVEIGIYASTLGLMAACAWMSRFPRYRVGIGAVLFVISDWLIFSRMGSFDLGDLPDLLIWPLYFAGQLMIATGVVQTLRGETPTP